MKQSKLLIPTLREVPSNAEAISHQLLLKAGLVKQVAAGVYSYLPLAQRTLNKIKNIIREEHDDISAVEMTMPLLQPAELWQESGRWDTMGAEMFRLKDRKGTDFALQPTSEEVITSLIRHDIKSYKQLPLNLYQIQTKFRDEARPRFGLLRGREFIMKDAYSFHVDEASLDETYQDMFGAYHKIFTRCGLTFRPVVADSGNMGGKDTHEFQALADIGEDTIVYTDHSDYAANIESAKITFKYERPNIEMLPLEKVNTPNVKTCDQVAEFLTIDLQQQIKSLVVKGNEDDVVLVLLRADHELNEVKLSKLLNVVEVEMADEATIVDVFGAHPGSLGPVNIPAEVKVYADYAVEALVNAVCGANEDDYHFINVNPGRDFSVLAYEDLRFIQEGEMAEDGSGPVKFAKGIEVGQVFKLGTRYSECMNAKVLDANGRQQPMLMGCYGIGVSRVLSAIIEQHHDENGIIWPKEVAPFDLHLLTANQKNAAQQQLADELYSLLQSYRYDVLYDDRKERAGVKFNDSDLIGLPIRILVGKEAEEGIVEVKVRKTGETFNMKKEVLIDKINELMKRI